MVKQLIGLQRFGIFLDFGLPPANASAVDY
jgi:hypothetical protein